MDDARRGKFASKCMRNKQANKLETQHKASSAISRRNRHDAEPGLACTARPLYLRISFMRKCAREAISGAAAAHTSSHEPGALPRSPSAPRGRERGAEDGRKGTSAFKTQNRNRLTTKAFFNNNNEKRRRADAKLKSNIKSVRFGSGVLAFYCVVYRPVCLRACFARACAASSSPRPAPIESTWRN